MSHRRSRSGTPPSCGTNSNDPHDLERRIFVGNLPTARMARKDLEDLFKPYGKIQAVSLFRGYGFVQFEKTEDAEAAKAGQNTRIYRGYKIDVNMAAERRQKPRSSPPRRSAGYGDSREPRPRSRSPVQGRESRDSRDGRDVREPSREPRPGLPRDNEDVRYRGPEGRAKDSRDATYRNDGHDRFYHGEYEPYRKKDDPYPDRYRENWASRREPEEERIRPEERRRNELYRQYYEELQRRYDAERPVDCSVIVVNKQQKEYAEMVGRKVRDLGMVVDLIFLNTEVSLTQALEDVSRARTPFAIIITQQHEVHCSCTVNILFGTPQEHRNMPMQDAMVLVSHNFDTFKVENRAKERDEISRKAAKMADEVLMREHDRQSHPVSVLTSITLLSEGRFLTPSELTVLINYLQDRRDRLVRGSTDSHLGSVPSSAAVQQPHETPQVTQTLAPVSHQTHQSTHSIQSPHLPAPLAATTKQQQELQAKILSLFNSGSGTTASQSQAAVPPTQGYGPTQSSILSSSTLSNLSMSAHDSQDMNAHINVRQPANNHVAAAPQGLQRAGTGINFDNPSVQKALDTLIQSGPAINQLVKSASMSTRANQGVGQEMKQGMTQGLNHGSGQGMSQGYNQGVGQGMSHGHGQGLVGQGMGQMMNQGMGQVSRFQRNF